jgi:hypothetical protein
MMDSCNTLIDHFPINLDPLWDGDIYRGGKLPTKPSFLWKTPSKWMPWRQSKKCIPQIIDYTKIRNKHSDMKGVEGSAGGNITNCGKSE